MRIHARLNVVDDRVVCPRSCEWRPLEDCVACASLERIDQRGRQEAVVCSPTVNRRMSAVIGDMIRP